jgi:hypothetical protein
LAESRAMPIGSPARPRDRGDRRIIDPSRDHRPVHAGGSGRRAPVRRAPSPPSIPKVARRSAAARARRHARPQTTSGSRTGGASGPSRRQRAALKAAAARSMGAPHSAQMIPIIATPPEGASLGSAAPRRPRTLSLPDPGRRPNLSLRAPGRSLAMIVEPPAMVAAAAAGLLPDTPDRASRRLG